MISSDDSESKFDTSDDVFRPDDVLIIDLDSDDGDPPVIDVELDLEDECDSKCWKIELTMAAAPGTNHLVRL